MNQHKTTHTFLALERALDLVRAIRPLSDKLARLDPGLNRQLRSATSSVPLNLTEGRGRKKGDRLHHWRIAHGSALEVRACLRTAEAWGLFKPEDIAVALEALDQVVAICWRLTH